MIMKRAWIFSVCFLLGCGSSIKLYKVDGVVTLDQKPLPNVIVSFTPVGAGTSGVGTTDLEGKYMIGSTLGSGVPEGRYKVSITEVPEVEKSNSDAYAGGSDSADYEKMAAGNSGDYKNAGKKKSKILDKYDAKTTLSADVNSSSTKFNFDLSSK